MIYFITGGQRSGKSAFAQKLAKKLSPKPVYLATSRVWDENHRERIKRHQADRDSSWRTIEEEKYISKHLLAGEVVVLDCVTLWLTNFFTDTNFNLAEALALAKKEFTNFLNQNFTLIAISNELGMGLHAESEGGRNFVDLQGWMNQFIAEKADEVFFMVSGQPLKVK
ncbi:cobalbumin biosynthesis protein [Chloroherpeton thalassium ATCC 35110]|uniref:Adenosylcobinamide kinase n=1 Tax=Chloroherpeton thalassium (strain ATCC 35110 / GB-78) TaxID=517418 RepID=B3QUG8_CHLT3|nr:bifunctional adenosylcobinamide kinase/adenosylcobinamide-phosphate guanylyltransferase [Chloroherpeton thalassium]ACF14417.1 cobalbumin biosynthesis protein [Chloroherpeton thalassium ATCC 35110]